MNGILGPAPRSAMPAFAALPIADLHVRAAAAVARAAAGLVLSPR